MPPVDLSIIIVNYNVKNFLRLVLQAVFASRGDFSMEVIVVDNDSVDDSMTMVRTEFPQVICLENDKNWGFAHACNQGIAVSSGRYLLFLNPDNVVAPDTLQTMLQLMEHHPDIGAAGCRMNAPDGTFIYTSRRGLPDPLASFAKLTGLARLFPTHPRLGKYNLTYLAPDHSGEVEALSGAFFLVRREVIDQVGGWDEAYFMYGEDLDWSRRIGEAGWRIYYEAGATCTHYYRRSSRRRPIYMTFVFHQAMIIYYNKFLAGQNRLLDGLVYFAISGRMLILLAKAVVK